MLFSVAKVQLTNNVSAPILLSHMRREIIIPAQCLRDHDFQDSMVEFKLMTRRQVRPGDLDLIPRDTLRLKPKSTHIAERIVEQLADSSGYIVPREDVAKNIYGNTDRRTLQKITYWWSELQHTVIHPENFLHKNHLGYAVGVTDMKLSGQELQIIYKLWLDMWNFVSADELAQAMYGIVDESGKLSVRYAINDLRKNVLPNTDLKINTRREKRTNDLQHQLTDEKEEMFIKDFIPPYLSFPFQDWLASEEVSLLQRKKSKKPTLQTNSMGKDIKLSELEARIVRILQRRSGYIIPYSYLSMLLYNYPDKVMNIQQVLNGMREKIVNPQDIYTVYKIGLATDVVGFPLSQLKLRVLYQLWIKQGEFISAKELLSLIYGEDTMKQVHNVSREVSELNYLLQTSHYEIVSSSRQEGFIKKDNMYSLRKVDSMRREMGIFYGVN